MIGMAFALFPLFVFNNSAPQNVGAFIFCQAEPDLFGGIAQLGEHLPCKQGVSGSNPLTSTNGFLGEIRKRNGPYYLRRATREHSSAG